MGCDFTVDPLCGGSEFPYHPVYLDAFDIDRYEVTVLQYRECVEQGACSLPAADDYCNYALAGREYHPVNCVSWDQANTYCAWAGKRLPTEAEWEKAARGTDDRLYPWGDATATCQYAVINDGGGDGCGTDGTLPVGSRPAGVSPYGIHDLAGNVLEWVADWYDYSYYWESPASNPTGPDSTDERSARGSGWFWNQARWSRASQRGGFEPLSDGNGLGFRCASSDP
jgi:formylglycine-generating enzyme required for sulfatase activity